MIHDNIGTTAVQVPKAAAAFTYHIAEQSTIISVRTSLLSYAPTLSQENLRKGSEFEFLIVRARELTISSLRFLVLVPRRHFAY